MQNRAIRRGYIRAIGYRTLNHEAGHTASLRHPWDPGQDVCDMEQGGPDSNDQDVRNNVMNSGGNTNPLLRSQTGTDLTKGQRQKVDSTVKNQQPKHKTPTPTKSKK